MTTRAIGTAMLALALLVGGAGVTLAQETQVRMWSFINPDGSDPRGRALAKLIENFEAANPDIDVVVETQVWDQISAKFIAAHGAGTAPDISWVHNEQLGVAVKVGAVANLRDLFVADWPPSEIADVDDAFWRYGATESANYMLAHSRNYFGLVYRPSMLREAGLTVEDLGTWDRFIEAAKKLTVRDDSGEVQRWGFGQAFATEKSTPQVVLSAMLARQGEPFDAEGRARWTTDAAVSAMDLQVDMVRKHKVTPQNAVSLSTEEVQEQFSAGRYAIISSSVVRIPVMQTALPPEDVAFAPWPGDTPGTHSPGSITGWCTCIWSGSEVMPAAARFVEYMSSREADQIWSGEAGTVPVRKSTITALADHFKNPAVNYLAVAAAANEKYGWLAPFDFAIGGYREDLNKAAQNILVRETDTREALEQAEQAFNRRHRR